MAVFDREIVLQLVVCDTGIRILHAGVQLRQMQYNAIQGWEADDRGVTIVGNVDSAIMSYETKQGSEICEALMERATNLIKRAAAADFVKT
eukprot:COSAG05_NODE_2834_length_2587_cov_1.006833_2_plen_91_part_00